LICLFLEVATALLIAVAGLLMFDVALPTLVATLRIFLSTERPAFVFDLLKALMFSLFIGI